MRRGGWIVGYGVVLLLGGLLTLFLLADLDRESRAAAVILAHPWALLLLASCALVAWVAFHLTLRRTASFQFSRVSDVARARPGWAAWLTPVPKAFRVILLGLIVVALARPQTMKKQVIQVDGIDLMLVLDLSKSMEEGDLLRDRLDAAQRTIRKFLVGRRNDKIGLVVFAKQAMLQCPPTLDHAALDTIVADLAHGDVEALGTAIGDGLGLALATLRRSDAKSKVIVLLTDGDSNVVNEMNPDEATELAKAMGVRVFTVLVGREEGDPQNDQRTRDLFGRQPYAVNPALLKRIAAETKGQYYHAGDDAALDAGFKAVRETLEKTQRKEVGKLYTELYPRFVYPALGLLLLELMLSLTRYRRFP